MEQNFKINAIFTAMGANKVAKDAMLVAQKLKSLNSVQKEYTRKLGLGASKLSNQDIQQVLGLQNANFSRGFIKQVDNSKKALKGFQAQWLSVMFFGMMVWRTFSGFFRDMITQYKELDSKGHTPLAKSLIKLQASFTFLKFSILEAMGPGLVNLINAIAELAIWISELDPETLEKVGWGIIAIAGMGGAALILGQLALGFAGLAMQLPLVASVIGGIVTGFLAFAATPAGILLLIGALALLIEKVGGLKNAFSLLVTGLFAVLGTVWGVIRAAFNFAWNNIKMMLNMGIDLINFFIKSAINAWNKVASFIPGMKTLDADKYKIPKFETEGYVEALISGFTKGFNQVMSMEEGVQKFLGLDEQLEQAKEFNDECAKPITKVIDLYYVARGGPVSDANLSRLSQSQGGGY